MDCEPKEERRENKMTTECIKNKPHHVYKELVLHKITQKRIDRFWKYIEKKDGCWIWRGGLNSMGYGQFHIGNGKMALCHRLSWVVHRGPIDGDLCILHKCDNPKCVNPDHLFIGTMKDNMQDKANKKRNLKNIGEYSCQHKLTDCEATEIRKLYKRATRNFNIQSLAKKYNIGQTTVWEILNGRAWKHLL
jgi:hypothetical protein